MNRELGWCIGAYESFLCITYILNISNQNINELDNCGTFFVKVCQFGIEGANLGQSGEIRKLMVTLHKLC